MKHIRTDSPGAFKAVWDSQPDACILLDGALDILWRNQAAAEKFPAFCPGENFLKFGDDFLAYKAKSLIPDVHGLTMTCRLMNAPYFINICEMPEGGIYLCRIRSRMTGILQTSEALKDLSDYEKRFPFSDSFQSLRCIQTEADGNLSEESQDRLDEISLAIMEVRRLTEMAMGYAMLKQGIMPHRVEKIDLAGFFNTVLRCAYDLMQGAGYELAYQIEEPITACTEPEYLLPILSELISNAYKFGKGSDSMVTARYEIHETSADIYVENLGGVSKYHRARMDRPLIFGNAFAEESIFIGNGLGLPAAREYAAFIGGELTMTEGDTTVFKLTFPLLPDSGMEQSGICEADIRARLRLLLSDVIAGRAYAISKAGTYPDGGTFV